MVTEQKIRVYTVLADLLFRTLLTLIGSGLWIYLTMALVLHPGYPIAAADSFMSMTFGVMFKYYFWRADSPAPLRR